MKILNQYLSKVQICLYIFLYYFVVLIRQNTTQINNIQTLKLIDKYISKTNGGSLFRNSFSTIFRNITNQKKAEVGEEYIYKLNLA